MRTSAVSLFLIVGAALAAERDYMCTMVGGVRIQEESDHGASVEELPFSCELQPADAPGNVQGYELDLGGDPSVLEQIQNTLKGRPKERISMWVTGQINGNVMEISALPDKPTRSEASTVPLEGTQTVLVLRVSSPKAKVTASAAELAQDIFFDDVNLAKQTAACSYGKLKYIPATGNKVVNGVLEVNVPSEPNATGAALHNEALTAAQTILGVQLSTFGKVLFCLPPGVPKLIAWANTNHWRTVYSDAWCNRVSAQMHEVGHNLGLSHTGKDNQSYADTSGYMGYAANGDDTPRSCYAGARSSQIGWYKDKEKIWKPMATETWSGKLIGIADYKTTGVTASHYVILQIQPPLDSTRQIFVTYNAKKGINADTRLNGDKVVVTSAPAGTSWVLAALDSTGTTTFQEKLADGSTLDVKVTSKGKDGLIDFAAVTVTYTHKGGSIPTGGGAWTECAKEGGVCSCFGKVRFGADPKWSAEKISTGSLSCNNGVFGGPAPGTPKICQCSSGTSMPTTKSTTSGPTTSQKSYVVKDVCGSTSEGVKLASQMAAVRCCSKNGTSGETDLKGVCSGLKDYAQAQAFCAGWGDWRLCSEAEAGLLKACGTGCGYDSQVVWTSTQRAATTYLEDVANLEDDGSDDGGSKTTINDAPRLQLSLFSILLISVACLIAY